MGFLPWRREKAPGSPGGDLAEMVALAQQGNAEAREALIRSYTPFVMRVSAGVCGRYIDAERDDEASVALLAFHEAINTYRADRSRSFLGFAETVIRRRLVDYFRTQRARAEVPLSDLIVEDEEGAAYCPAEVEAAVEKHREREDLLERQDEIRRYEALLGQFGITFAELARLAPKHRDAREEAKAVARRIAGIPAYAEYLKAQKALPLAQLERDSAIRVSRKTMERHRKYIIAVALILVEDFDYLKGYVQVDD